MEAVDLSGVRPLRLSHMLVDVDGARFRRDWEWARRGTWAAAFGLALGVACAEADSTSEPEREVPTEKEAEDPDAGTGATSSNVDVDTYCATLCDRGKTCDEAYDRQTCLRQCQSESGVVTNLGPALIEGWTACVNNTSCSTIATEQFVAECLADAANSVEPSDRGSQFCDELRRAADECSFTDYDERACWRAVTAYSDVALESGVVCAKKRCELIVDCLEATLKLPSEPDGSPIGFDDQGLSSSAEALPAVQSLLPETAAPDRPSQSTSSTPSSESTEAELDPGSTRDPAPTSAAPRDTTPTSAASEEVTSWDELPTDPATGSWTTETTSSTPPADSSVRETSTAAESSEEPPPRSECDQCLYDRCGDEENTCFGDLVCLQLVDALLGCSDEADVEGTPLDECFSPYVDAAYVSSPDSVFAFYAWTDCLTTAVCPVCE